MLLVVLLSLAAIIGVPILINFILQIETSKTLIGEPKDWLSFHSSYIGAIIGVAISLFILYFNKKDSDNKHNQLLNYQINFNQYIYEKGEYEEFVRKIRDIIIFMQEYRVEIASEDKLSVINSQLAEIDIFYKTNYGGTTKPSLSEQKFYDFLKMLIDFWCKWSGVYSIKESMLSFYKSNTIKIDDFRGWLEEIGLNTVKIDCILALGDISNQIDEIEKMILSIYIRENFTLLECKKEMRKSSIELLKDKKESINELLLKITEKSK